MNRADLVISHARSNDCWVPVRIGAVFTPVHPAFKARELVYAINQRQAATDRRRRIGTPVKLAFAKAENGQNIPVFMSVD